MCGCPPKGWLILLHGRSAVARLRVDVGLSLSETGTLVATQSLESECTYFSEKSPGSALGSPDICGLTIGV